MVNLEERRLLAQHVAGFVDGVLKPSEFIGRISCFEQSADMAVTEIVENITMFVDMHEINDTIEFSRMAWDDFQRVLLFLHTDLPETNWELRRPVCLWRWHPGQIAAIIGTLAAFCSLYLLLPNHPVYAYLACSGIAAVCTRWNAGRSFDWCANRSADGVPVEKLYPFGSAAQLIRERRQAREFAKRKSDPEHCGGNPRGFWTRERAWGKAAVFHVLAFAFPSFLLLMCLPDRIMAGDARRWC